MKTGAVVRLVQPVIQGTVTKRRINEQTDNEELLVEWTENGEAVQRWFSPEQLEEVTQ